MIDHGLLEISSVILPVDQRRQILGENELQKLHGGHFEPVDLVCVQIDLPLGELRRIGVAIYLPVAPHDE
ncbi:MAG: hypothetical protein EWM73_02484 [Nitrospira sp.]|nr:MAG: hypothetical protein EWM73_02484 [Nitrospira sp.]